MKDITLLALGKEWKLHKVYLRQSAYFASMFSGAWKESSEDVIRIEIVDPNINLDSLRTVLGSLYQDELTVEGRCLLINVFIKYISRHLSEYG